MNNFDGNNFIDYEAKSKSLAKTCLLEVIVFLILFFAMMGINDDSNRGYVLTLLTLSVLDIVLIIISYKKFKISDAKSKSMTLEEYDKFSREELERKKEELKESKCPKISLEGKIICPHCGSSNIQVVKRGWKVTTGFIGSSKNERVCVNCMRKF